MVDLLCCPTDLLFFDILLLCYYINLSSSVMLCLSSEIYIFHLVFLFHLQLPLKYSVVNFCGNFISSFITNQTTVASPDFWNAFLEAGLNESLADCLAWSRRSWLYLQLRFLLILLPISLSIFFPEDKNPQPFTSIWSFAWIG